MERELWKSISARITLLDRQLRRGRKTHSTGRVVRVLMWAALHDRPIYWACERRNWCGVRPPQQLPDQSTMSRRLRHDDVQWMLARLSELLDEQTASTSPSSLLYKYIDGKPLPVSRHSQDTDARFGRGAGGKDRGYKLHAIYAESGRPLAWQVHPLNVDERCVAHDLIAELNGEGYLLGDAYYDANALHDRAAEYGHLFVTPRRYAHAKGVGHHRHSPHRLAMIQRMGEPDAYLAQVLTQRRCIETRFAHLTNFGGALTHLPPWVRGLHRVRLWVHAKILIRLARTARNRAPTA